MLNEKQKRFVAAYLSCLNATEAALKAGYSKKTAGSQGSRLLKHVEVGKAISIQNAITLKSQQIDASWLLGRLVELANVDIGDIFGSDGRLRPIDEIPESARRLIASVEITERFEGNGDRSSQDRVQVTKIRLLDRLRALENIGRHVAVSAFQEAKSGVGTLVIIRDYTGRSVNPVTVDAERIP